MDSEVLGILGFILGFIALDMAALRFGHDSRSGAREVPLAGDVTITRPQLPAPRMRPRETAGAQTWAGLRAAAAAVQPAAATPFRPPIPGDVLCFEQLDLAATGK